MKKLDWSTQQRKVNDLLPLEINPRKITDEKRQKLIESIEKFNLAEIPAINADNTIIAGHQRMKAMQIVGRGDEFIDVRLPNRLLTDMEVKEYNLISNTHAGEWDYDVFEEHFSDVDLDSIGINVDDIKMESIDEFPEEEQVLEAKEDDYEAPAEIQTDIVPGDLFEIGPHRLLCGDSTNADDVAKLLNGANPILMVTDPPYGVKYDPNWRKEHNETKGFAAKTVQTGLVTNDDKADWKETYSLFSGDVTYVWHGGRHAKTVQQNLEDCGFEIVCQIIWNKMHGVFGRGDYHWQHEPCWYAVKKGKRHNYQGDRTQTTVWDIKGFNPNGSNLQKTEEKTGHGTQKPVECMARPIKNNTCEGEGVYDPFSGSGSTMVASHQLKRICFGLEIEPKYCQLIINRMRKLDPSIIILRNGKPLE